MIRTRSFVLGTAFLAVTASSSFAQTYLPQGPYVRLEGGWSHPEDLGGANVSGIPAGNATRDEGYIFGLAGGYKWQKWRIELDVDYSENDLDKGTNVFAGGLGTANLHGSSSNLSFMVNSYYDLNTGTAFTPYIGFGIGGDNFSLHQVRTATAGIANSSDVVFAYQPIIGVAYAINDKMSVGLEYRYFSTTDPIIKYSLTPPGGTFKVDPSSHNILASFTFHFGAPSAPPPTPAAVPAPAAPPAPPPAAAKQEFIVFFEFDKSTLTTDGQRVVNAAAAAYKTGGNAKISVAGYTDAVGTAKYNLALSQRRARTVSNALVKDGVPQDQIALSYFGKEHQRVPTPDGVREPQNRRVEIDF
jgi:outer membrane protein OmpA-like peptidoglycan-associated protein